MYRGMFWCLDGGRRWWCQFGNLIDAPDAFARWVVRAPDCGVGGVCVVVLEGGRVAA